MLQPSSIALSIPINIRNRVLVILVTLKSNVGKLLKSIILCESDSLICNKIFSLALSSKVLKSFIFNK